MLLGATMQRGAIKILEHNLPARLGNPLAFLGLPDAYTALEFMRHEARREGRSSFEIEVVSGASDLSPSGNRDVIVADLRNQLRLQAERLGIEQVFVTCRVRIDFGQVPRRPGMACGYHPTVTCSIETEPPDGPTG